MFVIGGLNGIVTAVIPFDWQLTDTYFVVSHLHYVLVGANMLPVFAAFYYWLPKMTGRMLDERLGTWSFWVMFIGFNMTFFPMHILGAARHAAAHLHLSAVTGWGTLNMVETVGAFVLGRHADQHLELLLVSKRRGRVAGANPWNADTMEWATESPPAVYGSETSRRSRPAIPLWDDFDEEDDPTGERDSRRGRSTLATSALDAARLSVAKMPDDTMTPF